MLSLSVIIYFGLQTILLQNMYQNPQSAAQVADGTSKHYRKLFSPEKKSEVKATLHCTWLVLCRKKKNECFVKIYIVCFPLLPLFTNLMFNCKVLKLYNLVGWYLIRAFPKTTWRICPIKLGQKIFCITLCLGERTILNCGSERSSSLWWRNGILSRTDFSYLFLFFLLCSFFYTDKNDYCQQQLTSSGIHVNEQERERHIKQNKICERLLLSCTNKHFFG